MHSLQDVVDDAASRTGFSGVVRVDRDGETELSVAYGLADRGHGIANTTETPNKIPNKVKSVRTGAARR